MIKLNFEIPDNFYKDEIRCDFYVTKKNKELWAVELDCFAEFRRVCEKYGLKYYAIAGTLLGAARHRGFIPWDDDMDLGMMWDDYKKLCEIGPKEFSNPYFFQDEKTDIYAVPDKVRIRRSDTTGLTLWEFNNVYDASCNRGIFIDVFPLFNVPDTEEEIREYQRQVVEVWKAARGFVAVDASKNGCDTYDKDYNDYIDVFYKYHEHYSVEQIRHLYLEKCAMYNSVQTKRIGMTSLRANKPQWWWNREWFSETIDLPFENTTIQCPKMYEEKLSTMYGDWQTPVRGTAQHEMFIFDADIPYSQNKQLLDKLNGMKS